MTADPVSAPEPPLPPLPSGPHAICTDGYVAFATADRYGEVIPMLRLRFRDGSWRAYPYLELTTAAYDPALGIELEFEAARVCLRGRHLLPLFALLADHAIRWCWEADRAAWLSAPDHEPAIERIEVGSRRR
ncbi:MAG: hypothetical protein U0871_01215 [Gemmataceae bacterium]